MSEQVQQDIESAHPNALRDWDEIKTKRRSRFRKTLTNKEHKYLYNHVWRYDGVQGVSAKEQFKQLIEYVFVKTLTRM